MPAISKTGPSMFLGIELATDQLRASLVDESLELIGVESVDFDTELPEYQTQGGIFTTPGEAYTTPVEMWLKGLDTLFEKIHKNYDVSKIKSVGGCAQHALVWWKSTTVPSLSSLDPHSPLHTLFPAHTFSLPNTPVSQDTSSQSHAMGIESLLGGPDHMAARVGMSANASMLAAQLLRVRETWPQDVWARTGRVQLASAFLSSLITGKWTSMGESEACATGIWVHTCTLPNQKSQVWDEGVLDIIGGSREEGRRVRGWLGDVDLSGGARKAGNVSRYLVDRYGFDPETIVTPFTSDQLLSYLSLLPSQNDAVLSLGPMDTLLTPAQHYIPTRLYNIFPHPAQDPNEKRKYIAILTSRNADVPRALVRDMYTKSWSAFDRLVAIVPPGGSIGLDDKLFSFWHLQPDSYPFSRVKGIYRFETGIKVNEFRDLRANPRCLIESQILCFRVKWSHMLATGVLGSSRKNPVGATPPPLSVRVSGVSLSTLGLTFDPYDHTPLPTRILATGAGANFPSVSNLIGDVFNAPVFIPLTQVDSAQVVPHRNAPAAGYASRASLGAAYVARWVYGREWGMSALTGFEEEMKRLLGRRWISSGGVPLKSNVNGVASVIGGGSGGGGAGGSGANSGASTPFGHAGPRSGLGNAVFEEDEDEENERDGNGGGGSAHGHGHGLGLGIGIGQGIGQGQGMGQGMGMGQGHVQGHGHLGLGVIGGGMYNAFGERVKMGGMEMGGNLSPNAYLNSEMGMGMNANGGLAPPGSGPSTSTPSTIPPSTITPSTITPSTIPPSTSTPTPLTPVVALYTGDAEVQVGLAKVAEPDVDAFLTYAAIVPEYCRLEGMVLKGIV